MKSTDEITKKNEEKIKTYIRLYWQYLEQNGMLEDCGKLKNDIEAIENEKKGGTKFLENFKMEHAVINNKNALKGLLKLESKILASKSSELCYTYAKQFYRIRSVIPMQNVIIENKDTKMCLQFANGVVGANKSELLKVCCGQKDYVSIYGFLNLVKYKTALKNIIVRNATPKELLDFIKYPKLEKDIEMLDKITEKILEFGDSETVRIFKITEPNLNFKYNYSQLREKIEGWKYIK